LRIRYTIIALFLFCGLLLQGQVTGLSSLTRDLGNSPRAVALGKANTGSALTIFDGLSNPALLASEPSKYSFGYTHNNSLGGIVKFDQLIFAVKPDSSEFVFGFNAYRISNTNVFNSLNLISNQNDIDFSALELDNSTDFGFKILTGKAQTEKLSWGLELNLEARSLARFAKAFSFGIDVGAVYKIDSVSAFSISIENVLGKYFLSNQNVSILESSFLSSGNFLRLNSTFIQLPTILSGYNRRLYSSKNGYFVDAIASLEIGFETTNTLIGSGRVGVNPLLGIEAGVYEFLYLRGGFSDWQRISRGTEDRDRITVNTSVGIGFAYKRVSLDYTISEFLRRSIPFQKHLVSLIYRLDGKSNQNNNNRNNFLPRF